MGTAEIPATSEQEKQPKYDAIIVFGRGVGKDIRGNWRPTPYVEEFKGGRHKGIFERVDPESKSSFIGGSNANVLAAVQLFEELRRTSILPKLVIFAAGRPDYLSKESLWMTEGRILEEKFRQKIRKFSSSVQTVILEQNKNTKDDINESLKLVANQGFGRVAIITIGVHIPRSREFFRLAQKEGKVPAELEVDFLAAEEILARRSKRYTKIFELTRKTEAHKRTAACEKEGVKKLRLGHYRSAQGGRF